MTPKFKKGDNIIHHITKLKKIIRDLGSEFYSVETPDDGPDIRSVPFGIIDLNYHLAPKEVTITRESLARAYDVAISKPMDTARDQFKVLCYELGLET